MIQKYIQYLRLIGLGKGRIFLHILIYVLDGVREFVVNIFAVSFYISCLQEGDEKRFFAGLLFFCGINLALRGVSRWYRECYSEQADILQEGRIVHRIEERATAVPYASYEKTAFLNRLEYLANHASATYEKIMGNIGNTVRLASALVAVLTYLATLDPVLFVVAIAPFLLTMVLRRQGEVRHDYEVEKSVHDRKKAYVWRKFFFHENMEELRTSDAYSILDHLNREAETGNCTLAREKGGTLAVLGFLADNLGATFAFTAGNIYALWKFWTQEGLPVSEYSVLVLSIANLNAKLVRLGTEYARFTENLLYVEDFLNFFAEEKPAQKDETQEEILQSVEAKQLSFTYPNGTAGLHDISFLAKKGERVVLVGENGAGKSTFLKVLLGLYPATVAENVLLRECKKEDEPLVWEALRKVGLEEKIKSLPQGIHTAVELFEEGEKAMFSAGEGQRLALCRVFAGDFDAVILDEPTAFLDPLTEADILQEVLEATKGKLLIFVTHRLSFARQADQILYLKNGMIAEHGMHEELMEKGGDYCRMFTTQRRQYFAQEGENDAV